MAIGQDSTWSTQKHTDLISEATQITVPILQWGRWQKFDRKKDLKDSDYIPILDHCFFSPRHPNTSWGSVFFTSVWQTYIFPQLPGVGDQAPDILEAKSHKLKRSFNLMGSPRKWWPSWNTKKRLEERSPFSGKKWQFLLHLNLWRFIFHWG